MASKKVIGSTVACAAIIGLFLVFAIAAKPSKSEVAYLSAYLSVVGGTASHDEALKAGLMVCDNPMDYGRDLGKAAVENLCPEKHDEFTTGWSDRDQEKANAQQMRLDQICTDIATIDVGLPTTWVRTGAWLVQGASLDEVKRVVTASCPQHQPIIDSIEAEVAGWEPGTLIDGVGSSWVVGPGEGQMRPGTWATTSTDMVDLCYWERTDGTTGAIIDNNYNNNYRAASKVTVTVRSGEAFTSNQHCWYWEKVA